MKSAGSGVDIARNQRRFNAIADKKDSADALTTKQEGRSCDKGAEEVSLGQSLKKADRLSEAIRRTGYKSPCSAIEYEFPAPVMI